MTSPAPVLRVLAVLVVLAGAVVLPGATGTSTACAAEGDHVAVVVDFGTVAGGPGGVASVCVPLADRANGAAVLAAASVQQGWGSPRYDNSGLLCAIAGYPATGCGERTGSGYLYWSYWHGQGGGWSYSSLGPGGFRARADTVEGWRFVEGAANPNDPRPRGSADPDATCPPPAPPTTEAPPPTPTPPTTGAVLGEPPPVAATPGPIAPVTGPPTTVGTDAPPATGAPGDTTVAPAPTTVVDDGATTTTGPGSPDVAALAATGSDGGGGGPGAAGVVMGAAAVAALAGAGVAVARRRGAT